MRLHVLRAAAMVGVMAALWLLTSGLHPEVHAQVDEPGRQIFLPVITRDHTPGWHWGEAYTVTVSMRTSEPPLAAIDRGGRPHLFWHDRATDGHIHHIYLADDGWQELLPSQGLAGDSSLTNQPLVDQAGRIHLFWFHRMEPPGNQPYRFQYAIFDGARWTEPEEIIRLLYNTSKAWVRLDQHDQPHLGIITGFLNWRALLLTLQETWQPIGDFRLPTNASVLWPDAESGAHLYGSDSNVLKYWRWLNGATAIEQTLGEGRLLTRSIAFDSADNMHLYWKANVNVDGSPVSLLHHQCVDEQRRLSVVSHHGGPGSVREVVSASEQWTLFALAWQESARKRIMLWDGCTPGATATIPEEAQQITLVRAVAVSSTPRKVCVFMQQRDAAIYTVRCAELD